MGATAFINLGIYNIAADEPHTSAVYSILERVHNKSIETHAKDIAALADFTSAKHLSIGAGLHGEMCYGCYLDRGVDKSEMSQGLYPRAPELAHA